MSLFDNLPQPGASARQAGFEFPASLTERYRPRSFSEFVGLDKAKRILAKFADAPYASAWLFVGTSGTGKISMALAFCEAIRGELHHIPSQQCNIETLENVVRMCHYFPANGRSLHVVVIDEADKMSKAAQLHFAFQAGRYSIPAKYHLYFHGECDRGFGRPLLIADPSNRIPISRFSRRGRRTTGAHLDARGRRNSGQA